MPVQFQLVSGFLCERMLIERDGVQTAIRLVDIFFVREIPGRVPIVQFFAVVMLKGLPQEQGFVVSFSMIKPAGKKDQLPKLPNQPSKLEMFENDPSVPTGVTIVVEINLEPAELGTYYLAVEVDGGEVLRIPFTLRKKPLADQGH